MIGNLKLAEYIYSIVNFKEEDILDTFFSICDQGNINIIKWFYIMSGIDKRTDNSCIFNISCKCKMVNIYQGFDELSQIHNYCEDIDGNDCLNGHVILLDKLKKINDFCRILHNTNENDERYYLRIDHKKLVGSFTVFTDINIYFSWLCMNGDIETVINVYNNNQIDINSYNGIIFRTICFYGRKEILHYLYNNLREPLEWNIIEKSLMIACASGKYGILDMFKNNGLLDDMEDISKYFQMCCKKNHFFLAKKLLSFYLEEINNSENINNATVLMCQNSNLFGVQWLFSIGADIRCNDYEPFLIACRKNDLSILGFLNTQGAINIFAANCEAINICCYQNNIPLIEWMFSLKDVDRNRLYVHTFAKSCELGRYKILDFLYRYNSEKWMELAKEYILSVCLTDNLDMLKYLVCFVGITDDLYNSCVKNNSTKILGWLGY
jgi:hypothetical protein